jgi:transposase
LLHEQTDAGLTPWFKEVQNSGIAELISFAKGLQRDEAAVRAGLSLKWSQGPVEGNINRLKLIKRSMYGRVICRIKNTICQIMCHPAKRFQRIASAT